MQKYKDLSGGVHQLDDVAFEYLLPAGCVPITEEEAAILSAPKPVVEDLAAMARIQRDELLRTIYDPAAHILLRELRLSASPEAQQGMAAKLAELDAYAVALQAVPQQTGFPDNINWPTVPTKEL